MNSSSGPLLLPHTQHLLPGLLTYLDCGPLGVWLRCWPVLSLQSSGRLYLHRQGSTSAGTFIPSISTMVTVLPLGLMWFEVVKSRWRSTFIPSIFTSMDQAT